MASRLDYCIQIYLKTNLANLKNLQLVQPTLAAPVVWVHPGHHHGISSWNIPMEHPHGTSPWPSAFTTGSLWSWTQAMSPSWHAMDPHFHWMRQSPVTLNLTLPWGSAVGSVSNKGEPCKIQKRAVSEAGARVKLTFARDKSNSDTVSRSQTTAKFFFL